MNKKPMSIESTFIYDLNHILDELVNSKDSSLKAQIENVFIKYIQTEKDEMTENKREEFCIYRYLERGEDR